MSWSRYSVISEKSRTSRIVGNPLHQQMATTATSAVFQINNATLYVPVVIFSIKNNTKFFGNYKASI